MPIIKSLPWRQISRDEAMANHLAQATPEELYDLRTDEWKAMRLVRRFQAYTALRHLGFTQGPTPAEAAGHRIADNLQAVGRTACGEGCGLQMYCRTTFPGETVSWVKAECTTDGCPDTGLLTVETELHELPMRAQAALSQFNTSAPQRPQQVAGN